MAVVLQLLQPNKGKLNMMGVLYKWYLLDSVCFLRVFVCVETWTQLLETDVNDMLV